MVRLPQEELALLYPPGNQIADRGGLELFLKGVGEVVLADVGQSGKLVQGQVFFKMVVDVPPHQAAFPAGARPSPIASFSYPCSFCILPLEA